LVEVGREKGACSQEERLQLYGGSWGVVDLET
jgi:hypothetical protein